MNENRGGRGRREDEKGRRGEGKKDEAKREGERERRRRNWKDGNANGEEVGVGGDGFGHTASPEEIFMRGPSTSREHSWKRTRGIFRSIPAHS